MILRICKLSLLVLFISSLCFGQKHASKLVHEYDEKDVKEYCWENEGEKYSETNYPEDWNNMSAIYLHYEDNYTMKKMRAGRSVTYIAHRRIKLLDKSALEDFSEIYYTKKRHGSYVFYNREKDFLGVKIIKPDGKEIIVDDAEIITDDEDRKKLAVPNLEVGDILDYYLYTYDYITNANGSFYSVINRFPIEGTYPYKHFDYYVFSDKYWDVRFVTGDENIEVEETMPTGKGKIYEFSINETDVKAVKSQLWHYPYMSSPYIKMFSFTEPVISKRINEGEIDLRTYELDPEKVINSYKAYYVKNKQAGNEYRAFKRYLDKKGKANISKLEFLEEYYYYLRHHFINMHYVYEAKF